MLRVRGARLSRFLAVCVVSSGIACHSQDQGTDAKKPVTVADAIRMTVLGIPTYLDPTKDLTAHFSPDRKEFIVVLKTGDIERNANKWSAILYRTAQVFDSPQPEILFSMLSSSNRDGIRNIKWLSDNRTITFVGEDSGELPQVYSFDVVARKLNRLTRHPTPVIAYDINQNGRKLVFEADPPPENKIATNDSDGHGLVVSPTQTLDRLLQGDCYSFLANLGEGEQLFLQQDGAAPEQIPTDEVLFGTYSEKPLSFSPDGRYVLIPSFLKDTPASWAQYKIPWLQRYLAQPKLRGVANGLMRYMLLDTEARTFTPLLNVPRSWYNDGFAWAPDGKSLALSGAFLPLDVANEHEREEREKNTFVAEIAVPGRQIQKIASDQMSVVDWNARTNVLTLEGEAETNAPSKRCYQKAAGVWHTMPNACVHTQSDVTLVSVTYDEDLNTPPKLVVSTANPKRRSVLLDLNPQFRNLRFGKEESITWKAKDGHDVTGGLYLPPGYLPGTRYPLVIQTHGFDPSRFWIDGPWSSAFAAQPLANQGFVVLQVGIVSTEESLQYRDTPQEAPRHMAEYEGAIDYLDDQKLIDRNKVGIIGFSRTCYHVAYTLTHSTYHFAAATLADGFNGGYLEYLAFPTSAGDLSLVNGGPPSAATMSAWMKNSPAFNLDKVRTPVRIEAYGPSGVVSLWEWFAGLSRLEKPVDFVYLPKGTHLLVKPRERLVSQQGNVDWFSFWLKDLQDLNPAKAAQYQRWQRLQHPSGKGTEQVSTKETRK